MSCRQRGCPNLDCNDVESSTLLRILSSQRRLRVLHLRCRSLLTLEQQRIYLAACQHLTSCRPFLVDYCRSSHSSPLSNLDLKALTSAMYKEIVAPRNLRKLMLHRPPRAFEPEITPLMNIILRPTQGSIVLRLEVLDLWRLDLGTIDVGHRLESFLDLSYLRILHLTTCPNSRGYEQIHHNST